MPSFRQTFWKHWYQYLSGRIGTDAVTFLNYGYWPPEGETLPLDPQDEINRPAILTQSSTPPLTRIPRPLIFATKHTPP